MTAGICECVNEELQQLTRIKELLSAAYFLVADNCVHLLSWCAGELSALEVLLNSIYFLAIFVRNSCFHGAIRTSEWLTERIFMEYLSDTRFFATWKGMDIVKAVGSTNLVLRIQYVAGIRFVVSTVQSSVIHRLSIRVSTVLYMLRCSLNQEQEPDDLAELLVGFRGLSHSNDRNLMLRYRVDLVQG